jgi:hypothetical protein
MKKLIEMPHEVHESTCYINGLFDIFKWICVKSFILRE